MVNSTSFSCIQASTGAQKLVLESLVQSGLLAQNEKTKTKTGPHTSLNLKRPDQDQKRPRPWSFSVFGPVTVINRNGQL